MLFCFLAVSAGCADPSKQTPEARGKGVYAAYNCSRCHRIGDKGGNSGPDLTFVGFRKSVEALDVWLKDPRAWQPRTLMPNFRFNDESRRDLAAYLGTLKGEGYRAGPAPWDSPELKSEPVRRGETLFMKLGCVGCHGPEGEGGYPNNNVKGGKIPDLTKVGSLYSKEELVKKIKIGVRRPVKADPAGPEPLLYMPAWGDVLKDDEVEALAAYLLDLYPPDASEDW